MPARLILLAMCYNLLGWSALLTQKAIVSIPRDFSAQRLPLFENGFVLAYDFDRGVVWSYDRTGNQLMQVQLTVPDATHIRIRSMAAAPDGTLAVTGSAADDHGRIAPVIFWISPAGAVARVVRTEPFSASQVAFGADGSLWAAGRVYTFNASNPAASQFQVAASYDVLRHYDNRGVLQQTALPRTSFAAAHDPAGEAFLAVERNRIGFLSVTAKEYVEISADGRILGRWNITSPISAKTIVGIALTSSGAVFASLVPRIQPTAPYQGPPVYQFDKASGMLNPAQLSTNGPTRPTALLGSDGDELVFYSKPPAAVEWFAVQ